MAPHISIKCLFHRRWLIHLIWFIGAITCNFSITVCINRYMPVISGNTWGDYRKKLPSGYKTLLAILIKFHFFVFFIFSSQRVFAFYLTVLNLLEDKTQQKCIIHTIFKISRFFSLNYVWWRRWNMEKHSKRPRFQSMVVSSFLPTTTKLTFCSCTAFCHDTKLIQIHFEFTLPFSFFWSGLPLLPLCFLVVCFSVLALAVVSELPQLRNGYNSLWNAFSDHGCPQPVLLHPSASRRKHLIETFPGNAAGWFWFYFATCKRWIVSFCVFRWSPSAQKKNKPEESVVSLFCSNVFNPW